MKKTMIWMILTVLLVLTACGALASGEIVLPEAEDLSKVAIKASELDLTVTGTDFITQLMEMLKQAKNTGRASVQDMPNEGAGLVQLKFYFNSGGASTLFLYREDGLLMLEQPYQGIYELDASLEKEFRQKISAELARRQISDQETGKSQIQEIGFDQEKG